MELNNEEDILRLIREDEWMMEILTTAKSLNLPDWWVCAGFVRSKIWDALHGYHVRTPLTDIDVIYFDDQSVSEGEEKKLEQQLIASHPNEPWSVKNEARMHTVNNISPYVSSVDAISKFPETATALGIKLDSNHDLLLAAPYGVDDVLKLTVKPTDFFKEDQTRAAIYEQRMIEKNWASKWGKIKVEHIGVCGPT